MKIVMTGGTGLIGNALGKKLVSAGHEVTVLARGTGRSKLGFPCRVFAWNGSTEVAPAEALQGCEAIFHLAGENVGAQRWSAKRKRELRDSRVLSAQNLQKGLEQVKVKLKLMLTASGVGYYGDRGDENLTENATAGHDFLAELCQEWEAAALTIPAERTVASRFGVVLSAQGGFLRQVSPLFTMFGASPLGSGKQWFSWIHIEDLVGALVHILEDSKISGVINVVAPSPVTNGELTRELAATLRAFQAPAVPKLALRLVYGELAQALVSSQRVIPARLQDAKFHWRFPTLKVALKDILPNLNTGELQVVYESFINAPVDEVWPFFSSEKNLERLTPPFLNFHVTGKSTPTIQAGTLIDYQLRLRGLPINWQSQITQWKEKSSFVDEQLKGPYQKWHHLHEFTPFAGGTLMRDTVHFKVPLGWVGRVASLGLVMKEVETIFAYRNQVIGELFAPPSPH